VTSGCAFFKAIANEEPIRPRPTTPIVAIRALRQLLGQRAQQPAQVLHQAVEAVEIEDCAPSDSAWFGVGCTSTINPCAPAATAASAIGRTSDHFPVACEGSTMIGSVTARAQAVWR